MCDVAAWRRDEDVNRGWTYGYPSWSSVEARWLPTSVPMGHCDAAPHDRGAAVRRRVGVRPPVGFEVPRGGAIRGDEGGEMCEACGPALEAGCTCARSSTGGWAG
jgi:hypothetical protein